MSNLSADPIFPAIEKSKAAWHECVTACDREPAEYRPREQNAWREEVEQVAREFDEAFRTMLAVRPVTRQGALALIDCFLETESAIVNNDTLALLERLREYLQTAS